MVATILLLALTVVLFSSIFYFVTTFPAPPAQNANQFQAQIIQAANGSSTMAGAISILHLAGPTVPASALIYLKSSVNPLGPEFASPYTVADGGITTGVWSLGQTWYLTAFAGHCTTNPGDYCNPILPDNITVYILSGSSLLFSAIIPGSVASTPPTFLSAVTTPGVVAIGEGFSVTAVIGGITSANTVTINESKLPGGVLPTTPVTMSYGTSNNTWYTYISAGATNESGNYYAFISASNAAGKTAVTPVPVTITPYSTLIGSALSVGTAAYSACTASPKPAACQATTDYAFTVTITASSVTFGSVLFEVYTTATGTAYTTAAHAAFAVASSSTPATALLSYVCTSATGPLVVSSSGWTTTYNTATATTPLTKSYVFSMDVGSTKPSTTAGTLSFIVIGTGAYSGTTIALALPAS